MASSEDEKPWPSSRPFGKFPMKENSVPGLPGGIWATQKRGSFKMSEAAQRNAAREARMGGVNPAHLRGTPSPSSTDGANPLPFAIPLQPTPKTGRSLSHSQGQREMPQQAGSQAAALPLGLLTEEDADTESESDLGSRLTHTTSHPPIGTLMRTATLPANYDYHANGRDAMLEQSPPAPPRQQTFESAFASLAIDRPARQRTHWQTHLGWDDVPNVNESRRHSLAEIPTRRGSLAAGEPSHLSRTLTFDEAIDDDPPHLPPLPTPGDQPMTRAQEIAAAAMVPAMYRVPYVQLDQNERNEIEARREQQAVASSTQWGANPGRPRKQLYIVSFKCSRVDVFYLLDNTGLIVREGDMVIVEADRGQDLGTVQHAKVTQEAARLLKKKYSEEQYKWLMMYSRNKDGGYNPNAQLHGETSGSNYSQLFPDAPSTMQGAIPRDNNLKPKAIKRLANEHEIKMLAEKEGNEAKAKRTCQQKVAHLRLQMEILDAEWQWDFQKLIFYYYADHYINFKDLITELYRIYKTRIWLSAINPASFSQHAMNQPPSGIGPGAMSPYNPYALNNSYTMAYGEDRDPYGAQMPYRIPYETYQPNWPAIPGVSNSFAPPASAFPPGQNWMFYGPGGVSDQSNMAQAPLTPQAHEEQAPSADPTNSYNISNTPMDYMSFYDRNDGSAADVGSGYSGSTRRNPPSTWNIGGSARQTFLPTPIGTARPTSQSIDYGLPTDEQRRVASGEWTSPQSRTLDPSRAAFNRQTVATNVGNGDRVGMVQASAQPLSAGANQREQGIRTGDRFFG